MQIMVISMAFHGFPVGFPTVSGSSSASPRLFEEVPHGSIREIPCHGGQHHRGHESCNMVVMVVVTVIMIKVICISITNDATKIMVDRAVHWLIMIKMVNIGCLNE